MQLKQYYLACLAHASYLIADQHSNVAAIVDPQRDISQYLQDAEAGGYTIKYVFLTHFHADFLAGHIELRNRTGARIHLGARAEAEFDFTPLQSGDTIEFGHVRLQILETPGHTPEGISILVFDRTKSEVQPRAVLTGDTLFIGDVGRPDLMASVGVAADDLADMLYDSLHLLRTLPDTTLVYPAHGAGSMCGRQLSAETVSTMGAQKTFNYALQPMSRDDFRALVNSDQPDVPEYFAYDAIRNRQERPDLDTALRESLRGLSLDEVLRLRNQGAQCLDVREAMDFMAAHLADAVNIGLRGKFATWSGSILSRQQPVVVIADLGSEEEAITRLGRIGFDNVAGYLEDGMQALEPRPDLLRSTPRISAAALAAQRSAAVPMVVVDVRSHQEWQAGHITGSLNIPLIQLRARLAEIPADRPVTVHCEGGYRSAVACSLLAQAGRSDVLDLAGGFKAWQAATRSASAGKETAVTDAEQADIDQMETN